MKIGALLVILFAALNSLAATDDNSIIYLRPTDAINLNPWQADDLYSSEIVVNVFEGLVRFKKNSTSIEPYLATNWSVKEGGTHWQFTLRHDVKFHDGTPFNAQSVLYSFQSRMGKQQTLYKRLHFIFSFITSIQSSNPYSVEITLDRPYAPFLVALADSAAFIIPPSVRNSAVFQPVGTGPFRFLSWSKGKSLILTRNPGYWGSAGTVERIIFKVMPESDGRLLQIKNGSADMVRIQSGKEFDELSRRSDIAILRNPSIDTHYLGFNSRRKPFDRKEVRAVFLHLINKGNMVKQIFQNLAEPAYTSLPRPIYPGKEIPPLNSFSLEVARILLKRANLENGFTCTLYFPDGQEGVQEIADLLTIQARKVKITIKKNKLPFTELLKAAGRGEHDLLLMGWSTGPDPDFFLYPLFTFSPGNRNRFFYENPELTRLLDEGKITLDAKKRDQIYLSALAILQKDVPWIPLFNLIDIMACNKKISGLAISPLGQVIFREVSKEIK
jgi:peptide/nickel transport system substrate-binding protein